MLKINVRKLIGFPIDVLWENLEGKFILIFDDGEIETNHKEVLFSRYVWEYHIKYPNTPFLKSHHVKSVLTKGRLGTNTHLDLINNVIWDVFDTYNDGSERKVSLLDDLGKMAYDISNIMYNDLTVKLEEYVTSLDIVDFISITRNPVIKEAIDNMEANQDGINKVYETIEDQFKNNPQLIDNPVVKAVNSGIVNKLQTLQCVGPRGFLTDIDSNIFKDPIKASFTTGLRKLHDNMIESRSAAKALMFSESPLQQSEYFSRRQQIICQNVRNLHTGDCGSDKYLDWYVRDDRYEGSTKISNCDLVTIQGKYYLDPDTNKLKVVRVSDRHLIGKTLKLRSVIAGCNHPDPYGICEVCYGETGLALPTNSNLGHAACVSMTADIGQSILSTKHYDGSSVVEGIVLDMNSKKYLSAPSDGKFYYLSNNLKDCKVKLLFESKLANSLSDINLVDNIEKLSLSRISEFEKIELEVQNNKFIENVTLNVCVNDRRSSLTYDILKFIKEKGWNVGENNIVSIDMTGWDFKKPILELPMRHFNMSDHRSCKVNIKLLTRNHY